MSRETKTFEGLCDFIASIIGKENAKPDNDLYRTLMNDALDIISRRTMMYETYWSNASGGDLTLTTNTAPLPLTCLRLDSVEWDGDDNVIDKTTKADLDKNYPGWRSDTGDPDKWIIEGNNIVLNTAPDSPTTGKLVARGRGLLPTFTTDATDTNPLTVIPWVDELLPAYYVLSELPFDPEVPREVVRQSKYAAKWEAGLQKQIDTYGERVRQPFKY